MHNGFCTPRERDDPIMCAKRLVTSGMVVVLLAVASSTMVAQSLRPTYSEPMSVISDIQTVVSIETLRERASPPITAGVPSSSMDRTEKGILAGGVLGVFIGAAAYSAFISESKSGWEVQDMLLTSLFFGLLGASIGGIIGS